jgi:metal-responsive CopG/Arc/MetJ family transcriptional regulator
MQLYVMKERITITLDKGLLSWLDKRIDDKTFANRSHGFEFLIQRRIEHEGTNNNNS